MSRHDYLPNLSHKVCPGLLRAAKHGQYTGGYIPYGLGLDSELRYCPNRDKPEAITTVRRIFEMFVLQDAGYVRIASELNAEGTPAPLGGKWNDSTIKSILSQEKYVGDYRWGKMPRGKYNQIRGGKVIEVPRSDRKNRPACGRRHRPQPAGECVVVEGTHVGIISRELWDAAQQKIARNRQPEQLRFNRRRTYALSGVAYCACGRPLSGHSKTVRGKKYRYYKCGNGHCPGSDKCKGRIVADELETFVLTQLDEVLLSDAAIDRLVEIQIKYLEGQRTAGGRSLTKLEKELSAVVKNLAKEETKATKAPADMVNLHYEAIRKLRVQRDQLVWDLDFAKQVRGASTTAIRQRGEEVRKQLLDLRINLRNANPEVVHRAMKQLIRSIRVTTSPRTGKRGRRGYPGTAVSHVDIELKANSVPPACRRIGLR